MEPFIQRMLERAAAQTEKLNEQLINAGHDIKKKNPLKENIQQITARFNNFIKSSDTFLQPENNTSEDNEQNNKENEEFKT